MGYVQFRRPASPAAGCRAWWVSAGFLICPPQGERTAGSPAPASATCTDWSGGDRMIGSLARVFPQIKHWIKKSKTEHESSWFRIKFSGWILCKHSHVDEKCFYTPMQTSLLFYALHLDCLRFTLPTGLKLLQWAFDKTKHSNVLLYNGTPRYATLIVFLF